MSPMMREYHVRICEGPGVKFPGPTRLSLFGLDVEQLLGSGGTHVFGHVERKQLLWLAYATECVAAQRHEAVC